MLEAFEKTPILVSPQDMQEKEVFNHWTNKKEKIKVVKVRKMKEKQRVKNDKKVVYNQWSGQEQVVNNQISIISKEKEAKSIKSTKDNFQNPFDKTKLGDMTLIPYNVEDYNHMQSYLLPNNAEDAISHETFFMELENIVWLNCYF